MIPSSAMNYLWSESFTQHCNFPLKEDILVQKIYHTHDPDGDDPDPELLIRMIETVLRYAGPMQVSDDQPDPTVLNNVDADDSNEGTLGCIIQMISHKIISKCYDKEDIYSRTLDVFDLLGNYRWDAKLLLALSAFAIIYGEFWLILQSKNHNPLAALIAPFKQLPEDVHPFKPIFRAIGLLVEAMVDVTRCVIRYEDIPIRRLHLYDDDEIAITRSLTYVASFWVVRSILVCTYRIENLKAMEDKQETTSISIALWELATLKSRIDSICTKLKSQVDTCRKKAEKEMHQRIGNVFKKPHNDNQEVLRELFALKRDLPLKDPSLNAKIGIPVLQDKTVILVISRPELMAIEDLHLLVEQTTDHFQHNDLDGTYKILWVPITATGEWTDRDILIFSFLSSSLPWYSIQRPWLLSSATVNHIKREWEFNDKPLLVVLDSQGTATNLNALDMIWIWGVTAYPFSTSKEEEMWRKQTWTLTLVVDHVEPLLSMWVEEGRTICIYGSSNLHWIRVFHAKMKTFQHIVPKLEVVYVGKKSPDNESTLIDIVSVLEMEKLGSSVSLMKMRLFWLRLESMRRSIRKLRIMTEDTDHILKEVTALLEFTENDANSGWMIIGKGSSARPILKLQGDEVTECLNNLQQWQKYLPKLGLLDIIRISQEPLPPEPCPHSRITEYKDEKNEQVILCQKCHRPMDKFIVYDVVQ